MFELPDKALAIFLIVAIPLLWGLGVEFAFELLRRRWSFEIREDEAE